MDYVLTTEALSKHYGYFEELDRLYMRVPKAAIYGFVGKNGAGKTTLIRLLCGLQETTPRTFSLYVIPKYQKGNWKITQEGCHCE